MSHSFGDLLVQSLHHKHGLSQSKLAAGIMQSPSIITQMCQGKRLNGPQARERVVAMIGWLQQQEALERLDEANALLAAAGMSALNTQDANEAALIARLKIQLTPHAPSQPITKAFSHNLPALLTSFVGRTDELTKIAQLIAANRLVTLNGAGGVGKTRLALEVAKSVVEREHAQASSAFPDGIWFVELATIEEGALSTALVAQAIGRLFKDPVQAANMTLDGVEKLLSAKQMLLIIDNCEHLVAACAEISERLLQHCWHLHILTTSREELLIPGEVVYPILPLSLPNPTESKPEQVLASAAAQLFVTRMGVTSDMQKIGDNEVAPLAHICRQLDGIPLALELAAPLTRSMTLHEIAAQLDNQMALLSNGYRTAIPRHQTMHNALVWSYRLLGQDEQQLLARVSVFVGGWTVDAAQAICSGAVSGQFGTEYLSALLHQLRAKSLVLIESQNGERRFRLLEPVRQFAQAQLIINGEQEVTEQRHAHYFLALAKQMDEARDTPQERLWLQKLEPERNNLRAVNRWAFAHNEAEFAQRFNGFLFAFWLYCSTQSEANHWLEGALSPKKLNPENPENEGQHTQSAQMAEAAALNTVGFIAVAMQNFTGAQAWFERELALRKELGDKKGIAGALRGISFTLMLSNQLSQAQPYLDQAMAICRAEQDKAGIAWSLFDLGNLALARGKISIAQAQLTEALPLLQEQGINFGAFRTMLALGHLLCKAGNNGQARQFYKDALCLQQQMHYSLWIADGLEGIAALAVAENDPLQAVRLSGAAHAHRQAFSLPRGVHKDVGYEQSLAITPTRLDPEAWQTAWQEGCAMSLEQAVEYALAELK